MIKAQVLIITVFIMLFLSLIGIIIANLESTYLESGRIYYEKVQSDFINDAGLERGKRLLDESQGEWRPWAPCPNRCSYDGVDVCSSCQCPPGCGLTCSYSDCQDCYLQEDMSIPPGGRGAYYRVYVDELPGGEVKVRVESGLQ